MAKPDDEEAKNRLFTDLVMDPLRRLIQPQTARYSVRWMRCSRALPRNRSPLTAHRSPLTSPPPCLPPSQEYENGAFDPASGFGGY